jgi:hypothetical protein
VTFEEQVITSPLPKKTIIAAVNAQNAYGIHSGDGMIRPVLNVSRLRDIMPRWSDIEPIKKLLS